MLHYKLFISSIFLLFLTSLQAGIYLEKPYNFNPKAAIVGCCYLHYQDKIVTVQIPPPSSGASEK